MRYPFVLFDIGETLIGPRRSYGAVYAEVLDGLVGPVSAELLDRSIRKVTLGFKERIPVGVDRFSHFPGGETEFWSRFVGQVLHGVTGREARPEITAQALQRLRSAFAEPDAWTVYEDVIPTLRRLTTDGVRLAVVSNWDSRLPRVLETLDLARHFEAVGVSSVERVEKPDPRLFLTVLERLGARPEQALHVGNVRELDLEGARAAGVDGLLVDRSDEAVGIAGALRDLRSLPGIARSGLPTVRPSPLDSPQDSTELSS